MAEPLSSDPNLVKGRNALSHATGHSEHVPYNIAVKLASHDGVAPVVEVAAPHSVGRESRGGQLGSYVEDKKGEGCPPERRPPSAPTPTKTRLPDPDEQR